MSDLKCFFNIAYTSPTPPHNLHGNDYAKYENQRKFYNLTADYNVFSYMLNGKKVMKNATAEDYFTRSNTNAGLFNLQGAMNGEQIKELKEKLKTTDSIIWHGVISFDEQTSLGFNSQEKAIKFLRQTLGTLFERSHLREDNVELYAAVHDDTDNRHIHFAFFEKEPLHRDKNGRLGYTKRGNFPQKALDNYLISANMHLSDHADEYYTARDRALARLNEIRKTRTGTRITAASDSRDVNIAINELIRALPKSGRLQYNAENMRGLRSRIDRVADIIISSDPAAASAHRQVLGQFARIQREVTDIAQSGRIAYADGVRLTADQLADVMGHKPEMNEKMGVKYVDMSNIDYFTKLQADYRARLGNVVLGMCKDINRDRGGEHRYNYARVNDLNRKIAAKNARRSRSRAFGNAMRVMERISRGANTNFIDSVRYNEAVIEYQDRAELAKTTARR